jgi:mannan endo-1,4-beta-mannosidase
MRVRARVAAAVCAAAVLVGTAGCSSVTHAAKTLRSEFHPVPQSIPSDTAPSSPCDSVTPGGHYVGFSVNGFPPDEAPLKALEHETGIDANIVSFYTNFGLQLNLAPIEAMCAQHVLPLLEIDTPQAVELREIEDGSEDPILEMYALDIGTLHTPIAVDFDHEFNGPWFKWGEKYSPASVFVAAWRHIVTVFRKYDATKVIWVWNPNVDYSDTVPNLAPWYPGNSYVSWIGLDGYFFSPTDTYASVFDRTIGQIRGFTDRPVLIVETGANPPSGRERAIASLFTGATATRGLLGLIWFDYGKTKTHDWYINNDPSALAAFAANAVKYQT